MAARFDDVKTIKMRVGALPLYPTNALRYNVTWSVDGLINEYCNPCEIVFNGKPILAPALEGLESVMIDGVAYEAFNTSGGLGTLADTLAGRVQDLSYKTLRYPGHAEIMKLLLQGLELARDRDAMRRILACAAPFTYKDVVVIFVTGIGGRAGRMEEESIVPRHYGRPELGAIQLTTAAGCVAMVELFLNGKLPAKGFVRQEDATLDGFLATRAGRLLSHGIRRAEAGLVPDGSVGGVERRLAAVLTTGDGMLVEFASAVDAVNCAMEVQAKMAERIRSASAIMFDGNVLEGDELTLEDLEIPHSVLAPHEPHQESNNPAVTARASSPHEGPAARQAASPPEAEPQATGKEHRDGFLGRRPVISAIGAVLLASTIAGGYLYMDYADHFQSTDDAFMAAWQSSLAPKRCRAISLPSPSPTTSTSKAAT